MTRAIISCLLLTGRVASLVKGPPIVYHWNMQAKKTINVFTIMCVRCPPTSRPWDRLSWFLCSVRICGRYIERRPLTSEEDGKSWKLFYKVYLYRTTHPASLAPLSGKVWCQGDNARALRTRGEVCLFVFGALRLTGVRYWMFITTIGYTWYTVLGTWYHSVRNGCFWKTSEPFGTPFKGTPF